MSIINEALKKTDEYLQKNAAKDNPLPAKPAGPKPFLLYGLILLAGLLLGNFIFSLLSHKAQTNGLASDSQNQKIQTAQTPTQGALPLVQTTSPPPTTALPNPPVPTEKTEASETSFILNGIFFSDAGGYALVNNQIVRVNDYVDGAKVSLITTNTVELDNSAGTITLSTQR